MGRKKGTLKRGNVKQRQKVLKRRLQYEAAMEVEEPQEEITPPVQECPIPRGRWINKRRVLVFSARGISARNRYLMNNIKKMLPHSKPEAKIEKKKTLSIINEVCEVKNCDKCLYFEEKKHQDCYLWISNIPNGPSAKFLVENIHTMEELKLTGNCLKGSRPILSFDEAFDTEPYLQLLKELFIQVFGTPRNHPKSQPFIDHVLNFAFLDNRIWFRNYQIEDNKTSLIEIGPRFVLNLCKIFEGSFSGAVLYSNTDYVTPNDHRRQLKLEARERNTHNIRQKKASQERRPKGSTYDCDPLDDLFQTIAPEKAVGEQKQTFYRRKF